MSRPLAAMAALALALTGCAAQPAQSAAAVSTPAPTPAATACCQQGMEFIWPEGTLPEAGTGLVVTGTFAEYDCGGLPSYHIVADTVEITA